MAKLTIADGGNASFVVDASEGGSSSSINGEHVSVYIIVNSGSFVAAGESGGFTSNTSGTYSLLVDSPVVLVNASTLSDSSSDATTLNAFAYKITNSTTYITIGTSSIMR